MAGETGKAGESRNNERRKRLSKGIPQSADEAYYRSGDKSVVNNSASDTHGRPGEPVKPAEGTPGTPRRKARQGDLVESADKKYYAGAEPAPTKEQIQQRARQAERQAGKGSAAAKGAEHGRGRRSDDTLNRHPAQHGNIRTIRIAKAEEVNAKLDEALGFLTATGGDKPDRLVIEVPKGEVARRARTRLEQLVTQEKLTEDEARDAVFSNYSDVPEPNGNKKADDEDFLDPDALLAGDIEDRHDGPDTRPDEDAREVTLDASGNETSNEPATWGKEHEHEHEDDGDDFLAPGLARDPDGNEQAPGVPGEHVEATFGVNAPKEDHEVDAKEGPGPTGRQGMTGHEGASGEPLGEDGMASVGSHQGPRDNKEAEGEHPATVPDREPAVADENPATLPNDGDVKHPTEQTGSATVHDTAPKPPAADNEADPGRKKNRKNR